MTRERLIADIEQLNERWGPIMNDPIVTDLIHRTVVNKGRSFLDDDPEDALRRSLTGVEQFRRIWSSMEEE